MQEQLEIGNSDNTNSIIVSQLMDGSVKLEFVGTWTYNHNITSSEKLLSTIKNFNPQKIELNSQKIEEWDSILITLIKKVYLFIYENELLYDESNLDSGIKKLIQLSLAVPAKDHIDEEAVDSPMLSRIGERSIKATRSTIEIISFLGDSFKAFVQLLKGKAKFRKQDLLILTQEAGAQALPIVTLISFLVGIIIAFVGAVQLEMFDAQIYVADLVGIAMVREMAPMMTAIILAGRSGASYAAQLGTMMVNEEIDALNTFGFNPYEFLVLPRLLALSLMMPLLVLYADFMGLLGGLFVALTSLNLTFAQYYQETISAFKSHTFLIRAYKR